MFYAPSGTGPSLKVKKSTGRYEASNVWFDPKRMEATSFRWWYFVKRIGGKVVFNDYSYSSYTTRHQRKVERTMEALGIKVDVVIQAPKGLQDLPTALLAYQTQIKNLTMLIQKPGTRKAKNEERAARIRELQERVKTVQALIKLDRE